MSDLTNAAAVLRDARDATLIAHVNPDADALGSAFALGHALRARGARVRVAFGSDSPAPHGLAALDPCGLLVPASAVPPVPDLVITLDCGSPSRLGTLAPRVEATKAAGGRVLVVDHHVGTPHFGTDHLLDDTAVATAVLVLDLLDELGTPLDRPIAQCLYAGILTDSGGFRRADGDTHRVAARLLDTGVNPDEVARILFDARPASWLHMLSTVLARTVVADGLIHTVVRADELAASRPEDVDTVVDLLRATADARVAAVGKELSPGRWSFSLRSMGEVDVRAIAMTLGGGGHVLAAGFTADGTAEDLIARVRQALLAAV